MSYYLNIIPYIPQFLIPKLFTNLIFINKVIAKIENLSFLEMKKLDSLSTCIDNNDLTKLTQSIRYIFINPENYFILSEFNTVDLFVYNLLSKIDNNVSSKLSYTSDVNIITNKDTNLLITKIINYFLKKNNFILFPYC